jgi:spore germination cell wall hydrolase CwlJ-like protein
MLLSFVCYSFFIDKSDKQANNDRKIEHLLNESNPSTSLISEFDNHINNVIQKSSNNIHDLIEKSKQKRQIVCIAENIYYESRDQSHSGKVAVAMVTMNRSKISKLPPCKVVYERNPRGCQFTWTCSKIRPAWETAKWKESLVIAYLSYNKMVADITSGATYYFNPYIIKAPKWAYTEIPVTNQYIMNGYLGSHRFFKASKNDRFAMNN